MKPQILLLVSSTLFALSGTFAADEGVRQFGSREPPGRIVTEVEVSTRNEESSITSCGNGREIIDAASTGISSVHSSSLLSQVRVGTRVQVYWPDDDKYYPGRVTELIQTKNGPRLYKILYDDGDIETLDLSSQTFRVIDNEEIIFTGTCPVDGFGGGGGGGGNGKSSRPPNLFE